MNLIATLSKSEKRYFKMNAERNSKGKSKQFIKMFEAIDKGQEPLISSVNPSVASSYLYNSILHSLNSFQEASFPEKKIARLAEHGLILYKKGLPDQSMKLLEKALKLAENYEDHLQIQQICSQIRNILASYKAIVTTDLSVDEVLEKNLKAAKDGELMARLRFVQMRFQTEVSMYSSTDVNKTNELQTLLSNSAIMEVDENSTVRAQLTALNIWSQYHLLARNSEKGLEYGKRVFDLCFANQNRLYEGGPLLVSAANNYMVRCHRAEVQDEVARVLNLLETLEFGDIALETKRKEVYYTHWLAHRISKEKLDETEKLDEIDVAWNDVATSMNQAFLMLIYSLCSQYAFLDHDHRSALKWINRFLIHENRSHLAKNIAIAEVYRMLVYYMQGKMDLIESELNGFEARNQNVEYPVLTQHLLNFLYKELNNGQDHAQNVESLRSAILKVKKSGSEYEAFHFFPFDKWVIKHLS